MAALQIRRDDTPLDLRRRAARERDRRAAMRLLALANALEGMTRAEAARLAGMERQALHDAVIVGSKEFVVATGMPLSSSFFTMSS